MEFLCPFWENHVWSRSRRLHNHSVWGSDDPHKRLLLMIWLKYRKILAARLWANLQMKAYTQICVNGLDYAWFRLLILDKILPKKKDACLWWSSLCPANNGSGSRYPGVGVWVKCGNYVPAEEECPPVFTKMPRINHRLWNIRTWFFRAEKICYRLRDRGNKGGSTRNGWLLSFLVFQL